MSSDQNTGIVTTGGNAKRQTRYRSSDQNPDLFYTGDYTRIPSYMGMIVSPYQDPYDPILACHQVFLKHGSDGFRDSN